jgi:hypothetical protein
MSKTIADKLGLHKYKQAVIVQQPAGSHYFPDLSGYDTGLNDRQYDLIFGFVLDAESLRTLVYSVIDRQLLAPNGYLYTAYPKKGNTVYPTYIHRDELFGVLGSNEEGFIGTSTVKFSRMVGLDEVFTVVGFKNEANAKSAPASKSSQRVDDYVEVVPQVEKDLADAPELLAFYRSLPPGYRKDWARYVYSAKQEATRAKRREEMKMILGAGYKSRDLYMNRDKG